MRRLAGTTKDIQPKYDNVGGDAANDNTKQNNREYKEVDPNAKPVVNELPDDVSQAHLGTVGILPLFRLWHDPTQESLKKP